MQKIEAFQRGDGSHRGLSHWYPEKEAALKAALDARKPFDTGWYKSKHEIASARIWSDDGQTINVKASVSDDFDTEGLAHFTTKNWALCALAETVDEAFDAATKNRNNNAPYVGFSIHDSTGAWIETYILSAGEYDFPPGDDYNWWGWQHDEIDEVGIPNPRVPADAVAAFEAYVMAGDWSSPLTVSGWTIRPWKD